MCRLSGLHGQGFRRGVLGGPGFQGKHRKTALLPTPERSGLGLRARGALALKPQASKQASKPLHNGRRARGRGRAGSPGERKREGEGGREGGREGGKEPETERGRETEQAALAQKGDKHSNPSHSNHLRNARDNHSHHLTHKPWRPEASKHSGGRRLGGTDSSTRLFIGLEATFAPMMEKHWLLTVQVAPEPRDYERGSMLLTIGRQLLFEETPRGWAAHRVPGRELPPFKSTAPRTPTTGKTEESFSSCSGGSAPGTKANSWRLPTQQSISSSSSGGDTPAIATHHRSLQQSRAAKAIVHCRRGSGDKRSSGRDKHQTHPQQTSNRPVPSQFVPRVSPQLLPDLTRQAEPRHAHTAQQRRGEPHDPRRKRAPTQPARQAPLITPTSPQTPNWHPASRPAPRWTQPRRRGPPPPTQSPAPASLMQLSGKGKGKPPEPHPNTTEANTHKRRPPQASSPHNRPRSQQQQWRGGQERQRRTKLSQLNCRPPRVPTNTNRHGGPDTTP